MEALRNPRRIATTILLFLFLAGGSGAAFGFVSASNDIADVSPFRIPEPTSGDRAVYTAYDASGGRDSLQEVGELRVTWRETITVYEPGVGLRTAYAVRYNDTTPDDWGEPRGDATILVDVKTYEVFGFIDEWSGYEFVEPQSSATEIVGDSWSLNFFSGGGSPSQLPCGVVSPFHGLPALPGDTRKGAVCHGVHWSSDATSKVRAVRHDEATGDRFLEVWMKEGFFGSEEARIWYSESIPFPVRIEIKDGIWPNIPVHYELTAYERGDPVPTPHPEVPHEVELEYAPTTPWLFDETGIDHPFPASEAYARALDDEASGLEAFLADNPEAYMVDLYYHEDHDLRNGQETTRYQWRMTFRDEDSIHDVWVDRVDTITHPSAERDPVQDPMGFVEDLTSPSTERTETTTYEVRLYAGNSLDRYGPFAPMPDALPTVASMWAYWDAFASADLRDKGPNFWDATIHGWDHDDRWESRIILMAGRSLDVRADGVEEVPYDRDWAYLSWEFQDGPLPYRYSERGFEERHIEVAEAAHGYETEPSGMAAISVARVWALPAAAPATGIGLGALVLSLLYHFWPVVKSGGAVGMFSRVQPGELLEHPLRQSIHAHVEANPGTHYKQIVRSQEASRSTVDHHLRKLAQAGMVVAAQSQGYTCYFVKGAVDRRMMAAPGALKSPVAAQLMAMVEAAPGIRTNELARRIGVAPATVSYHLKRLRDAGLIEQAGRGHAATELGGRAAAS